MTPESYFCVQPQVSTGYELRLADGEDCGLSCGWTAEEDVREERPREDSRVEDVPAEALRSGVDMWRELYPEEFPAYAPLPAQALIGAADEFAA